MIHRMDAVAAVYPPRSVALPPPLTYCATRHIIILTDNLVLLTKPVLHSVSELWVTLD